jgi:hypothetical protein
MDDLRRRRVRYDLHQIRDRYGNPYSVFIGKRFGILDDLASDFVGVGSYDNTIRNASVEADDGIFDPIDVRVLRDAFLRKWSTTPEIGRFRDGPWPGIGHCSGSYKCRRYPRTTAEIAANENDLRLSRDIVDEFGLTFRENRLRRELPTAWNDVSRHREKNWKRYRKTRWR